MTCVLTSAWHPFNSTSPWSPMNPDIMPTSSGLERQSSHGYASSGSESHKAGSSSGKKRASRAGTRSVTTLSAAQLERKRANDREAQRAIRQRTKDHIEHLERSVSDLRSSQESNDKLVIATQQRNRELEDENAYLRSRLNEAGYPVNLGHSEGQRPAESTALLAAPTTSPTAQQSVSGSSVHLSASGSTPRSLSATTASQSSSSRHGSFQQQGAFLSAAPSASLSIADPSAMTSNMNLTTWRPHDGTANVPSVHGASHSSVQDAGHAQPPRSYAQTIPSDRGQWGAAAQQYHYSIKQEQPPPHAYEPQHHQQAQSGLPPPPPAQQSQYMHTPMQTYTAAPPLPALQAAAYHPPQLPPHAEFQSMAVSSPSSYQVPPQTAYQQPQHTQPYQQPHTHGVPQYQQTPSPQSFQQPSSYQMTPVQVQPPGSGYTSPQHQMQPPPMPSATYQAPTAEQHYTPQHQMHPPLQYREDAQGRSYALTHYPSG